MIWKEAQLPITPTNLININSTWNDNVTLGPLPEPRGEFYARRFCSLRWSYKKENFLTGVQTGKTGNRTEPETHGFFTLYREVEVCPPFMRKGQCP